jgi:hypothetical protein
MKHDNLETVQLHKLETSLEGVNCLAYPQSPIVCENPKIIQRKGPAAEP